MGVFLFVCLFAFFFFFFFFFLLGVAVLITDFDLLRLLRFPCLLLLLLLLLLLFCHRPSGSAKGGHGIFNVRNDLSVCRIYEGLTDRFSKIEKWSFICLDREPNSR